MYHREIALSNHSGGKEERRRVVHALARIVPVGQEVAHSLAAGKPVAIETGDGQHVRHVDLAYELLAHLNQRAEKLQAFRIEGSLRRIGVHGRGHSAYEKGLQVRVLAAHHGMHPYEVALEFQRIEIVGNGQQVHFGRQTVGRMAPVPVGEQTQLAALHQSSHACLNGPEMAHAGLGPVG